MPVRSSSQMVPAHPSERPRSAVGNKKGGSIAAPFFHCDLWWLAYSVVAAAALRPRRAVVARRVVRPRVAVAAAVRREVVRRVLVAAAARRVVVRAAAGRATAVTRRVVRLPVPRRRRTGVRGVASSPSSEALARVRVAVLCVFLWSMPFSLRFACTNGIAARAMANGASTTSTTASAAVPPINSQPSREGIRNLAIFSP